MQISRPYARTAAGQVAHARPRRPSHEPTAGQVAGRGDETVTWVILSGLLARKGSLSEALSERLCRMARTALTEYSFCNPALPVVRNTQLPLRLWLARSVSAQADLL